MRYREVGGARVSVVGLGTWQFGSGEWGYGEGYAAVEAAAIVTRALDLGVNLIDTAEVYGGGQSEIIVGQAIKGRRDEAFVATKVWPVKPVARVVEAHARRSAGRLEVVDDRPVPGALAQSRWCRWGRRWRGCAAWWTRAWCATWG